MTTVHLHIDHVHSKAVGGYSNDNTHRESVEPRPHDLRCPGHPHHPHQHPGDYIGDMIAGEWDNVRAEKSPRRLDALHLSNQHHRVSRLLDCVDEQRCMDRACPVCGWLSTIKVARSAYDRLQHRQQGSLVFATIQADAGEDRRQWYDRMNLSLQSLAMKLAYLRRKGAGADAVNGAPVIHGGFRAIHQPEKRPHCHSILDVATADEASLEELRALLGHLYGKAAEQFGLVRPRVHIVACEDDERDVRRALNYMVVDHTAANDDELTTSEICHRLALQAGTPRLVAFGSMRGRLSLDFHLSSANTPEDFDYPRFGEAC